MASFLSHPAIQPLEGQVQPPLLLSIKQALLSREVKFSPSSLPIPPQPRTLLTMNEHTDSDCRPGCGQVEDGILYLGEVLLWENRVEAGEAALPPVPSAAAAAADPTADSTADSDSDSACSVRPTSASPLASPAHRITEAHRAREEARFAAAVRKANKEILARKQAKRREYRANRLAREAAAN